MGNTNFKTILGKDPYELGRYRTDGSISLAALTEKNSDFIEAVVQLDSNYKKEAGSYPPRPGIRPRNHGG
jgi:hypothetical protein